jgi:hypothetical protein
MPTKTSTPFSYTINEDCNALYPPVSVISPNPPTTNLLGRPIRTLGDVVAHYTLSSLKCDNIAVLNDANGLPAIRGSVQPNEYCTIDISVNDTSSMALFAQMHQRFLGAAYGQLAFSPVSALQSLGIWDPMEGFPVNNSGKRCEWAPFLPLGMGMLNQKAVTLLHYPPYVAMENADYLHNQTLFRWQMLLQCNGISPANSGNYNTFVDINPIAAPGSGQSEYPNDYLPIMMASFYDQNPSCIRNMLDLLLNPPHSDGYAYTLPLLIGGSPDYDPQAPGWFRVRYKDQLPQNAHGVPQAVVGQVGTIKLMPGSTKATPYMIVNHMIAAGVEGLCTSNPASPCDIRNYEAHDLAAANFLSQYASDPSIDPSTAQQAAFIRWFGNPAGTGIPVPPDPRDRLLLCAMAQMDVNFEPSKQEQTRFDEALSRCTATANADPCAAGMPRDNKPCCCKHPPTNNRT